jgi:hypothetical protein
VPARKNRPDKFRGQAPLRPRGPSPTEKEAIAFFVAQERARPGGVHYTPWDLVKTADDLCKQGLLLESPARGCYRTTYGFWMAYINPNR